MDINHLIYQWFSWYTSDFPFDEPLVLPGLDSPSRSASRRPVPDDRSLGQVVGQVGQVARRRSRAESHLSHLSHWAAVGKHQKKVTKKGLYVLGSSDYRIIHTSVVNNYRRTIVDLFDMVLYMSSSS